MSVKHSMGITSMIELHKAGVINRAALMRGLRETGVDLSFFDEGDEKDDPSPLDGECVVHRPSGKWPSTDFEFAAEGEGAAESEPDSRVGPDRTGIAADVFVPEGPHCDIVTLRVPKGTHPSTVGKIAEAQYAARRNLR